MSATGLEQVRQVSIYEQAVSEDSVLPEEQVKLATCVLLGIEPYLPSSNTETTIKMKENVNSEKLHIEIAIHYDTHKALPSELTNPNCLQAMTASPGPREQNEVHVP